MNIKNPANELKSRARRYGFVVLLQPERPSGWLALVRPAGNGFREPGTESLDVYTELKTVVINHDPGRL